VVRGPSSWSFTALAHLCASAALTCKGAVTSQISRRPTHVDFACAALSTGFDLASEAAPYQGLLSLRDVKVGAFVDRHLETGELQLFDADFLVDFSKITINDMLHRREADVDVAVRRGQLARRFWR
jgi:hypothetical protein